MDENLIRNYLHDRFRNLKQKKILIYGTGAVASRLVDALADFNIVGVLDRVYVEGEFCNLPILTWEDITQDTADIVIIAAARKNYKIIFERIQYYCFSLDITIYGENGQNLSDKYHLNYIDNTQIKYFQKNEEGLKKLIDQYDAVSFDLFDTLVMRKIMEPEDIFELVEQRVQEKGIIVENFRKKRQTAAIQSKGGNIDKIYDYLRTRTGITQEESALIKQEELQCEKDYLIPRKVMVDIMNYAIQQGKIVSIISDMHLPSYILVDMLFDMGISGYHKLYVSCEYGKGKSNGLFQIYLQDVGDVKCLHIGDNLLADVVMPRKYGIDSYEVKSAYEMLKVSSLRKILICSNDSGCHIMIGFMLSEIFNNPFALYHTMGVVEIEKVDTFVRLFIAPLVLIYMQRLLQIVKLKKYEAILFSARDGYLFKKIYDTYFLDEYGIPSVYFLTSRKLCLTATLDSKQDILDLCQMLSTEVRIKSFLKQILTDEETYKAKTEKYKNIQEYVFSLSEQLESYSMKIKKNYKKYFEKLHIYCYKKYLFCDLNSRGTAQAAINRIFSIDLDGLYLCKKVGLKKQNLSVASVYNEQKGDDLSDAVDLLETILTSTTPSVCSMDEKGEAVYDKEKRTVQELQMVKKADETIMNYIQQCRKLKIIEKDIDSRFPKIMLELLDSIKYVGEIEFLMSLKHIDDLSQISTDVL